MDHEEGGLENEITDFARQLVRITMTAPLRMTDAERQVFKILDSAMAISEYTDKVDCWGRGSKWDVMVDEIRKVCFIISGLVGGG